jgi:hypothetical protein
MAKGKPKGIQAGKSTKSAKVVNPAKVRSAGYPSKGKGQGNGT